MNQNSAAALEGSIRMEPTLSRALLWACRRRLAQISFAGRVADPIHVPGAIDRDKDNRPLGSPCLVLHLGRDVVEATRAKLLTLALVLEDGGPLNHGVGFVRAVPVYGHVHLFGRADQQLRRVGLGIDPENRDLRRIVPQLRNHRLPPQVFVSGAHGLGSTAGRRCTATVALRRTQPGDQQQKTCDSARFDSSSCTHIHWDFLLTSKMTNSIRASRPPAMWLKTFPIRSASRGPGSAPSPPKLGCRMSLYYSTHNRTTRLNPRPSRITRVVGMTVGLQ